MNVQINYHDNTHDILELSSSQEEFFKSLDHKFDEIDGLVQMSQVEWHYVRDLGFSQLPESMNKSMWKTVDIEKHADDTDESVFNECMEKLHELIDAEEGANETNDFVRLSQYEKDFINEEHISIGLFAKKETYNGLKKFMRNKINNLEFPTIKLTPSQIDCSIHLDPFCYENRDKFSLDHVDDYFVIVMIGEDGRCEVKLSEFFEMCGANTYSEKINVVRCYMQGADEKLKVV